MNKTKYVISGAVVAAASNQLPQPTVVINIQHKNMHTPIQVNAVADTGAMISVGGPDLMHSLGLTRPKLNKCGKLRDVADRPIDVWGSTICDIKLNGRYSQCQIYFIPSAKRCFLSLTMCKDLGLVHQEFPLQLPSVAAITGNLHSGPSKDMTNRQPEKADLSIP